MTKLIITLTVLFLFGSSINPALPVAAQDAIRVVDQSWEASFRDYLAFDLVAESSAEIVEVELLYRIVGQIATARNEVEFTPGTQVEASYTIDQNDPSHYQPPGTELEYWWKIEDAAGNELRTEPERIIYLDDRYEWRTLENERLSLYWYSGDDDFGQALFDRANEALDTLEQDFGAAIENPIKIFIYGKHSDLLGAIRAGSQEWTGGQAFTEYGVVVIGVEPRQLEWGLGAMTHEMSHLVIHQVTDNPFGDLPRWLDEGIAVYNENREELDDDFKPTFDRAVRNDELMTLRALSSPFPADPLEANLAYGQSGAMVKYMIDAYGPDAMSELLAIFAEGAIYDEALEQAIDLNTDQLDNAFRTSLGLPPLPGTETPEQLTQAEMAVEPDNAEAAAEEEAAEEAGAESASVEEPASETMPESAPSSETTEQGSPLTAIPCLGGILAGLILGLGILIGWPSR